MFTKIIFSFFFNQFLPKRNQESRHQQLQSWQHGDLAFNQLFFLLLIEDSAPATLLLPSQGPIEHWTVSASGQYSSRVGDCLEAHVVLQA